MAGNIELNPVSHLTIGAVGPPGQRTFYLQGSRGAETVSLIIEKQQAAMAAESIEALLNELERQYTLEPTQEQQTPYYDLRLREPLEPLFRVGKMGLGFSEETDRVVLVAYELVDEGEDPAKVSFWASREQVRALAAHADEVVRAGRPICGNCRQPIDADGHFCPNRNGHLS